MVGGKETKIKNVNHGVSDLADDGNRIAKAVLAVLGRRDNRTDRVTLVETAAHAVVALHILLRPAVVLGVIHVVAE